MFRCLELFDTAVDRKVYSVSCPGLGPRCQCLQIFKFKRIATNSDFIIAISLQPNVKIFQTMKFVWSIHLILKYQRFTPSGLRSIIYKLYFEKIAHWYQMNFKDFLYNTAFSVPLC